MKINTDVFPLKDIKQNERHARSPSAKADGPGGKDNAAGSVDTAKQVRLENRVASHAQLADFKNAELEVSKLKNLLAGDSAIPAELHQLDDKRVLFLSVV